MRPAPCPPAPQVVTSMAVRGLRCICLAYTDYALEDSTRPDNFFDEPDVVRMGFLKLLT